MFKQEKKIVHLFRFKNLAEILKFIVLIYIKSLTFRSHFLKQIVQIEIEI